MTLNPVFDDAVTARQQQMQSPRRVLSDALDTLLPQLDAPHINAPLLAQLLTRALESHGYGFIMQRNVREV